MPRKYSVHVSLNSCPTTKNKTNIKQFFFNQQSSILQNRRSLVNSLAGIPGTICTLHTSPVLHHSTHTSHSQSYIFPEHALLYCSCQCPHLCFNSLRKNPWNTGEDLPSIHQPGVIDGCLPLQGTCHTSCDSKTNTKALVAKQHSKMSWTRTANRRN